MRNLISGLLLTAALATAVPTLAQSRDEIRQDRREVRQGEREVRANRTNPDVSPAESREDRRELREDRQELREDRRDYRRDVRDDRNDRYDDRRYDRNDYRNDRRDGQRWATRWGRYDDRGWRVGYSTPQWSAVWTPYGFGYGDRLTISWGLRWFDNDRNGRLNEREWRRAQRDFYRYADRNRDGYVSHREYDWAIDNIRYNRYRGF